MRPDLDLAALIDQGSILTEGEREGGPLRLSAGLACPRKLALVGTGAPEKALDAIGARVFRAGRDRGAAHAAGLLKALEGKGCVLEAEVEVWLPIPGLGKEVAYGLTCGDDPALRLSEDGTLEVRGRLDVTLRRGGRTTVVEFKTASEYAFDKVDASDWHTASEEYVGQVGAYAMGLRHTKGLDALTDCALVYEHKDSAEIKVVWIPIEAALEYGKRVQANLCEAARAIAAGDPKLAKRAFGLRDPSKSTRLDWHCEWCAVASVCWKEHGLTSRKGRGRMPELYLDNPEVLS